MPNDFATYLLMAGFLLVLFLWGRSTWGKNFGDFVWVSIVLTVFVLRAGLSHLLGGRRTTPPQPKSTPASPSAKEPDIETRADLTVLTVENEATSVKPATSIDEFRRRRDEDGI